MEASNILRQLARERGLPQSNDNHQTQEIINQNIEENQPELNCVNCEFCQVDIPFDQYYEHVSSLCQFRPQRCQYCHEEFPINLINDHLQVCPKKNNHQNEERKQNQEQLQNIIDHHEGDVNISNYSDGMFDQNNQQIDRNPQQQQNQIQPDNPYLNQNFQQQQNAERQNQQIGNIDVEQSNQESQMVQCPICNAMINGSLINFHIDAHSFQDENIERDPQQAQNNNQRRRPAQQAFDNQQMFDDDMIFDAFRGNNRRQNQQNRRRVAQDINVDQMNQQLQAVEASRRMMRNMEQMMGEMGMQRGQQGRLIMNGRPMGGPGNAENIQIGNMNIRYRQGLPRQVIRVRIGGAEPQARNEDSQALKNLLPTYTFNKAQFENCGEENKDKLECRICMVDFEDGDELRQMQCFHHYHKQCIDKWLETSKKCPLCNHEQESGQ